MSEEAEFEHESLQDPHSLVRYLEALGKGFDNGSLTFDNRDGSMSVAPRGVINFTVRATRERGRVQLRLEFDWKEDDGKNEKTFHINGGAES